MRPLLFLDVDGPPSVVDDLDERVGLHWKTPRARRPAGGRPFAWVDDEITALEGWLGKAF